MLIQYSTNCISKWLYNSRRPNRNPNSDYGKWIREERRSNGITSAMAEKRNIFSLFFLPVFKPGLPCREDI